MSGTTKVVEERPRSSMRTLWSSDDPREFINKRSRIIISAQTGVSRAWVETKHSYHIELHTEIPGASAQTPSGSQPMTPGSLGTWGAMTPWSRR